MRYNVQQRAECVGTFRWIAVYKMELLARWVPTTPEMEVKVLFGRHVWDCAQHADALGKRAFELRAPLHFTLPPSQTFQQFLRTVADLKGTDERVHAFYDVACRSMTEHYRTYLGNTDALMDEPTVRIIELILRDYERMAGERERLTAGISKSATPGCMLECPMLGLDELVLHGVDGKRAKGTAI